MKFKSLLVLVLVILSWALPGPVGAQADDTWYFAVGEGQLVAYALGGEVNVLVETGVDDGVYGWRLGPQSALVALSVADGLYHYYHLTPDAAQPLTFDFETEGLSPPEAANGKLAAYRDPYVVLMLSERPHLGLLADMDTGMVTPLQHPLYYPFNLYSARFSADGQLLRYMGSAPDDSQPWRLQERDLASGEERTIHTLSLETNLPYITTDTYGEQWIVSVRGDEGHSETLLDSDGSSEVLPGDQISEGHTLTQLFEDDVIAYVPCNDQCELQLNPGTENESVLFVVPQITSRIEPIARVDDQTLLVQMQYDYLLLEDEPGADMAFKSAETLGFWALGTVIPTRGDALWSGRWLATVDQPLSPTAYRVWDGVSKDFVLEGGPGAADTFWIASLTYGDGGVLVMEQTLEEARAQLYRAADGAVIELPAISNGEYVDVLPDGTVLYSQVSGSETLTKGIYHYDPDTETYTLLVEAVKPIKLD
jgi:hypothetical protein